MKQIGEGSGRKVFDLENGFVLKQWYTEWGRQQNINEIKVYNSICNQYKKYLAVSKIFQDDNILMEKVVPIDEQTFKTKIEDKNFYRNLISYLSQDMKLNGDITNYSSWGLSQKGQYVLLDYGYTHKLYNDFMWEYTRESKYLDSNYIEW